MKATLLRKALRDMRGHMGSYLACAMVMAIGVMIYASMTQVVGSIPKAQEVFYRDCRFAEGFASVNSIPQARLGRLAGIEGVAKVSGRLVVTARVAEPGREGNKELTLISYDPAEQDRLNDIMVTRGAAPRAGNDEICVNENFYNANGFELGDTLTLALLGKRVTVAVTGRALTPEYIYLTPEGSILPNDEDYGVAYMPLDQMEAFLERRGERNDIAFTLKPGTKYESVEDAVKTALAPNGLIRLYAREDQASHSMLTMEIEAMHSMVGIMPILFLGIGALIMSVVVKRMVEQQHAQIGLMKAYGYTNSEVLSHYAIYGVAIGLMASVMGGLMGAMVAEYMAKLYRTYFVMPGISGAFSLSNVLALSVLALAFGVGASLYGARGVLRLSAAEAMHTPAPPSGKPILLERVRPLWLRLSSTAQLSLRNLFRARSRSALTLLGLVVCYALTAAVFAFEPMIDYMMSQNFADVQRYDAKVALERLADARGAESALRRLPGVASVEAVLELPATIRAGGREKDATVLAIPASGSLYRLYDDKKQPVALPAEGAVLTYRMAKNLRVGVGDRILLDIPYPERAVPVTIAALTEQYTTNYVVMDAACFARAARLPRLASGAFVAVDGGDAGKVDALSERLESARNVSGVMNVSQVQQSMNDMIETSMSMLYAMAVMAVFAGFAIVYNAAVVILSERTRELASMRVMGFTLMETVRVVAREQLLLCLAGILLGIPLAVLTMQGLSNMITTMSDAFAIPADVPLLAHGTSAACMLLAWLAAVGVTARKVKKTAMADVLKERD